MMTAHLRGQTAIVTGGTRGIGYAIARALAIESVNVVITGLDARRVDSARRTLDGEGPGGVEGIVADGRDETAVARVVDTTVARFGAPDILINNAGVGRFDTVEQTTPAVWHEVIATNLTSAFYFCRAAVPQMRLKGGGYIINVSSLAGANPFAGGAAYCASKAGLNAFSEALMQEVRHDRIRVSCVLPGSVSTEFSGDAAKGADWKLKPGDVAEVVLSLLRSDPRSLTSRVEIRPSRPRK